MITFTQISIIDTETGEIIGSKKQRVCFFDIPAGEKLLNAWLQSFLRGLRTNRHLALHIDCLPEELPQQLTIF